MPDDQLGMPGLDLAEVTDDKYYDDLDEPGLCRHGYHWFKGSWKLAFTHYHKFARGYCIKNDDLCLKYNFNTDDCRKCNFWSDPVKDIYNGNYCEIKWWVLILIVCGITLASVVGIFLTMWVCRKSCCFWERPKDFSEKESNYADVEEEKRDLVVVEDAGIGKCGGGESDTTGEKPGKVLG
jgi:hypothetical protein